jgi:hypothetical protein
VLTPLVARRNGHVDTRMVLGRYGHMFEGARRQEAETMVPRSLLNLRRNQWPHDWADARPAPLQAQSRIAT